MSMIASVACLRRRSRRVYGIFQRRSRKRPLPCLAAFSTIASFATPPLFPLSCDPDVMTPIRRKIHRTIVTFPLVLAACGPTKPPPLGLDETAHALDAARSAGAATYAPLELRNAEEHLSQARANAEKRDYDTAQILASESRADSELAGVKSRLGK